MLVRPAVDVVRHGKYGMSVTVNAKNKECEGYLLIRLKDSLLG